MAKYAIYIKNKESLYIPLVCDKVTVEWSRSLQAGTMKFEVVKDEIIDYQEGNPVVLTEDNKPIFKGFVFTKKRNADQIIETTCYDQLRYLKNKDSMQFENKTYSEYVKMICDDGFMKIGDIEDTKYKIPARTERDKEYFQMLQIAADLTLAHTGKEYVLYDDAGKICLKEWAYMPTMNTIVTYDIAQNFDYETSIDNAYNRIKVNYVDDLTGETKAYIKEDEDKIWKWGRLQYYAETSTKQQIEDRAKVMLELLNRKHRSLTIKNVVGNFSVRGGSLIPVHLPMLGDINVNSLMLVDKVTHYIEDNAHFMDLVVFNKDIMPTYAGKGLFEGGKQRQKAQPPVQMAPIAIGNLPAAGGGYAGSGRTGAAFIRPSVGPVTSNFGASREGGRRRHAGIDIAAPTGTKVAAAQGGVVIYAKWASGYGNLIKIRHPDGTETRYAHLSGYRCKKGDRVDIGQTIGLVGNTGNSHGAHLHFEIHVGGRARNPKNYVKF